MHAVVALASNIIAGYFAAFGFASAVQLILITMRIIVLGHGRRLVSPLRVTRRPAPFASVLRGDGERRERERRRRGGRGRLGEMTSSLEEFVPITIVNYPDKTAFNPQPALRGVLNVHSML